MLFLFIFCLICVFLVVLLNIVSLLISESVSLCREELTSYECGFEHHNLSRIPFSFRYFLLTLIFLLFDLEVVLLLGVSYLCSYSVFFSFSCLIACSFLLLLILGLFMELLIGSLDWVSFSGNAANPSI